jgi:2-oxoglutarate ferredoxin oxidoreductase subunit beta
MTYLAKPKFHHPDLPKNSLGYTHRDYEGSVSTLCAGCGHDSITASIIQACFELAIDPHRVAKISGIGCSSKTPTYMLGNSHGFNSVHGRMPSVLTGANLANRDLIYLGVSGDGDSASIGFGQFAHAIRRAVRMVYIVENNGVYGLTKGQFSASADIGTKSKKGEENQQAPVDPCLAALSLGGTFIARSFSGDKEQLVPLIRAGLMHKGFAMIDVISPCVTFNDHVGSTKSYAFTREHYHEAVHADYVPPRREILASYAEGEALPVQMHDGSQIVLRKLDKDYDPTHRGRAFEYLRTKLRQGEHVTGLIFVSSSGPDMHAMANTSDVPLNQVPYQMLHPGSEGLAKILKRYA